MTDEEILKKAIEKAIENGFNQGKSFGVYVGQMLYGELRNEKGEITEYTMPTYYQIIFSHEFAKAFWGDYDKKEDLLPMVYIKGNFISTGIVKKNGLEKWQLHLSQMVLEPDPLKYLEKFL